MQTIAEKVSVNLSNGIPVLMSWRNRDYQITKVGLHHTFTEGHTLYHAFSVLAGDLFLKLRFDTKNLTWNLIQIYQE